MERNLKYLVDPNADDSFIKAHGLTPNDIYITNTQTEQTVHMLPNQLPKYIAQLTPDEIRSLGSTLRALNEEKQLGRVFTTLLRDSIFATDKYKVSRRSTVADLLQALEVKEALEKIQA